MKKSSLLKLSLFATGIAGIVAEYVLSTLATYFLGDSIFQWTMIVSIMLFSMGLGSRFSRLISKNLLFKFILIEFLLSVLSGFAAIFSYYVAAFTEAIGFFIYLMSISVGILIGLEIPLVARLNEEFEELKVNISNVLEKDYYGSLIGGLFFAFIGIPHLGLTYTPFILAFINFFVAFLLLYHFSNLLLKIQRKISYFLGFLTGLLLFLGVFYAKSLILFGEQAKYRDKVIYEEQSKYQKIVITEWKNEYWLYLNGNQQLCTIDEFMYHEPLVHSVMALHKNPKNILVLGGGDGCAVREILKYKDVEKITLVDLDPAITELAKNHVVLKKLNKNSLLHEKVTVLNEDAFSFLNRTNQYYDIIIADFPDPKSVELSRLYSIEFYNLVKHHLRSSGFFITQAGSPYFATSAFLSIQKTIEKAGFYTLPLHNHVMTLGEWGFVLASKTKKSKNIKNELRKNEPRVETRWLNKNGMNLITSFGKSLVDTSNFEINTLNHPTLYKHYIEGNWDLY
jgi:spermidine synthase